MNFSNLLILLPSEISAQVLWEISSSNYYLKLFWRKTLHFCSEISSGNKNWFWSKFCVCRSVLEHLPVTKRNTLSSDCTRKSIFGKLWLPKERFSSKSDIFMILTKKGAKLVGDISMILVWEETLNVSLQILRMLTLCIS